MDAHFSRMLRPDMAASAAVGAYFIPSEKFKGAKRGCVFKRGEKGVGYYYDPVQGFPLDQVAEEQAGRKRKMGDDDDRSAKRRVDEEEEMSKADIERLLQEADKADVMALDHNGLQQLVLAFEKKINKNQKLRMKYPDEPERFVESELDLHAEVTKLAAIAAAPELFPQFVELGALVSMLGLLTHENTDVSISVLAVLQELIDPETFEEEEEAIALLDAFLDNSGLELLVQNLSRLDETSEEDAQGVHYTLQIIENLSEIRPSLCVTICEKTQILPFLLARLKQKNFDSNKLYCSEVLCILLQADTNNQRRLSNLPSGDGLDDLLKLIAAYRKRDPSTPDEEEYMQNLFTALCAVLLVPENQARFRIHEGFELMMRCLKEKKLAALSSLKVIDFAIMNNSENCEKLIDAGGLKFVFPVFMGHQLSSKKQKSADKRENEEQIISIISTLCVYLHSVTTHDCNLRLIGKFLENDGEKIDRLMELFGKFSAQLRATETALAEITYDPEDPEWEDVDPEEYVLERRLAGGLYTLQRLSIILAFAIVQNDKCAAWATAKFQQEGIPMPLLHTYLREYLQVLGQELDDTSDQAAEDSAQARERDELMREKAQQKDTLLAWSAAIGQITGAQNAEGNSTTENES